jgi:SAM-dependent methyltransferase
MSFVLAAMGAREVQGIEMDNDCLASYEKYKASLSPVLQGRLHARSGDAAHLPYEESVFDAVIMVEVCSHLIDTERTFREALRVLAPQGVLLISDGNNIRNPLHRRLMVRRWAEKEEVIPPVHYQSYRARRAQWLMSQHPDLAPDVAAKIAAGTPLHTYAQVEAAYQKHHQDGVLPSDRYVPSPNNPAIHPAGYADDTLLDAERLCDELKSVGFRSARCVPSWARSTRLRRAIDDALRLLPAPVTWPFARLLRVVATK